MRIIGGTYGGRRLKAPRNDAVRPTGERVREAIFNLLGPLDDMAVLDLFAGTGALGLEALSRGASRVVFVDAAGAAVRLVRENIALLGDTGDAALIVEHGDALKFARRLGERGERFDLILIDPPYDQVGVILTRLLPSLGRLCRGDAKVLVECDRRQQAEVEQLLTDGLGGTIDRSRKYGDTAVVIVLPNEEPANEADMELSQ